MAKRKMKTLVKAKKKEAIAQASWKEGKGVIRINSRKLDLVEPEEVRTFIQEPLMIAGPAAQNLDIRIHITGGGNMSQAVAARACIAKSIMEYTRDEKLRKAMLSYDRMLLVDDPRRTEPKKPLGPKARRKKQHSKR